jgi:hypothetical protein
MASAFSACSAYPDRQFPASGGKGGSSLATGGAAGGGTAGSDVGGIGGSGGTITDSGIDANTGGSSGAAGGSSDAKLDAGDAGPICKQPGPYPMGLDCRCADGTVEQVFSTKMVGCADVKNDPDAGMPGTTWDRRTTLCGFGCRVCTAAEWVAGHPSGTITPPTYNYWTDDNLQLTSGSTGNCTVALSDAGAGMGACPNRPMRVCVAAPDASGTVTDPAGTTCDVHECGLNSARPDDYFGGCVGNRTAGALCCCGP